MTGERAPLSKVEREYRPLRTRHISYLSQTSPNAFSLLWVLTGCNYFLVLLTYLLTYLLTSFVQLVVGSLCVGSSSAPSQGEDKPLLVFVRSFFQLLFISDAGQALRSMRGSGLGLSCLSMQVIACAFLPTSSDLDVCGGHAYEF